MIKLPHSLALGAATLFMFGFVASSDAAPRPSADVGASGSMNGIVHNVQATDPRVFQLEEQVRQLRGRVEELNFIMLELQEQIRRTQEDYEFRFQQLEERDQSNGSPAIRPVPGQTETAAVPEELPLDALDNVPANTENLGSIQFDIDGNPVGTTIDQAPVQSITDNNSLLTGAADYDGAYSAFISGDFMGAEQGFRAFVEQSPDDALAPNAHYWLGESLLAQNKYNEAAEMFLETNRQFPDGAKAPEALLKLGVAMSGLQKNDIACAVFDQFDQRYPNATAQMQTKLQKERQRATCS